MRNNKIKKAMACIMSATFVATSMVAVGCKQPTPPDNQDFDESVDTSKTQLYVGNFNGGLGFEWIMKAKARFEAENPNVQIMIDNGKDEYAPSSLMANIKTNRQDLYVVDGSDYYTYVQNGMLMDITDVVTEGGATSIESRMNETLRNWFKTPDNKYYAVPFYQSFYHLIYDVDLFDTYNLWLNEAGTDFVTSKTDKRYPGPAGGGTGDDGLPYTYSQFFMLLEKMVSYGITPITATGEYKDTYFPYFIDSVFADYAGAEFVNNMKLEGEVTVLKNDTFTEPATGTFTLNGLTEKKTLTNDNKSEHEEIVASQAGKYFAVKFAKDIMSQNYKYVKQDKINSPSESHTMAQATFLDGTYIKKPVGMLIDGGWWYNEAKVYMEEMVKDSQDEKWHWSKRRFGVMPFPKDDTNPSAGRTVSSMTGSAIFISNYTTKADLAKKFFKFIHTEESLQEFTATTLVNRPYNYEMDAEYLSATPYYTQNMNAALKDITVVAKVAQKPELIYRNGYLTGAMWTSTVGNDQYSNPLTNFFEYTSLTALDYFKGLKTYAQTRNYWG